jgi:hypothetical protein
MPINGPTTGKKPPTPIIRNRTRLQNFLACAGAHRVNHTLHQPPGACPRLRFLETHQQSGSMFNTNRKCASTTPAEKSWTNCGQIADKRAEMQSGQGLADCCFAQADKRHFRGRADSRANAGANTARTPARTRREHGANTARTPNPLFPQKAKNDVTRLCPEV